MANQADESIKVHATTGGQGPTLTFVVPSVAINPDNTYGFSVSLDASHALIRSIQRAQEAHRFAHAEKEANIPLRGQRVRVTKDGVTRVGTYIQMSFDGEHLVANMGKTKHDYFHLDEITFDFPDAPESEEEHFLAIHDGDGWVR